MSRSWSARRGATWSAAPTVLGAALALAAPAAGQQDVERENLTGIRDVNVVVADLADDVERAGLTRRGLLVAVERRLEERGVRLGSSRQAADLYVDVTTHLGSTGLYAYYARVSVQQLATIEGNQLRAYVDTWDMASLGTTGGANLPRVEEVVLQIVDLFCDDYLEVNDRRR